MLESTRKRGAGILVYVIFGMLIVIFVINFGAQSSGSSQGCKGESNKMMVSIGGTDFGMNTWRWAYNTRGGGTPEQRTRSALDALIRREMLAQEASARGMEIGDSVIDQKIKDGDVYIMGEKLDGKKYYFSDGEFFDYKLLERFISEFGLSIGGFKAEQRHELLAQAMETVLASGGLASRDEAYAVWAHNAVKVTVDAVTFNPADYAKKMILTDADVDRFLTGHATEVQAYYDAHPGDYKATPAALHLRRIMVKKTEGKKPEEDPAKKTIDDARADIVAKKKTFAQVATALDADEVTRARGGDLGWKTSEAPGLPTPDLDDAAKKLTKGGDPSEVVATADAYWLLWVEDTRSGDLKPEQVQREIAAQLATEVWSKEKAKRDALAALDQGKAAIASGKTLEDVFELKAGPPSEAPDMNQFPPEVQQMIQELQDPNTTDERKQELQQQIMDLLKKNGMGRIDWESEDIPASWQADGPTAPAPVGDKPAETKPVAPPVPKADPLVPTTDVLPKFAEMGKVEVARLGPMSREKDGIADVGKSPELVKAVWDDLQNGQIADHIFAVTSTTIGPDGREISNGDAYVVLALVERTTPDPADFDKSADDIIDELQTARGQDIVKSWLGAKCKELVDGKRITIGHDVLVTKDDKGQPSQIQYGACGNL